MADFVAEFTLGHLEIMQLKGNKISKPWERIWKVYIDGASNCRRA